MTHKDAPPATSIRDWFYYPVVITLTADGNGPADISDAVSVIYEVWDRNYVSISSHDNLYDAIDEAMRLERLRLQQEDKNAT